MNSIPASQLVQVVPGVLGAGGNPLSLNAVFLTQDTSIPIGTVQPFATLQSVQDWFGPNSTEAALAAVYFSGFIGCTTLPGTLYFAQYNTAAVSAYLRSGSFAAISLAQLQALSGVLIVAINGEAVTSATIDLSGATSFSNAAALIQTGLQTSGGIFSGTASMGASFTGVIASNVLTVSALTGYLTPGDLINGTAVSNVPLGTQITGTPGGTGTYNITHADQTSEAMTSTSTTLDVTAVASGALHVGDIVTGTGIAGGSTVTAILSGTGGVGTYTLSGAHQSVASEAVAVSSVATVTYDSLRSAFVIHSATTGATSTLAFATGSLAAGLRLTSATGAVLSQGAAIATPAGAMAGIVAVTQNWATFMTVWEPLLTDKLGFAAWVTTTADRYTYVCYDSDVTALAPNATGSFGVLTANDSGVVAVWDPTGTIAAFICGTTASIDFTATNGRITYAYKSQAGLVAAITDATVAANLIANHYNFYGSYATANQQFTFLQPGQISGAWLWIDEYVNQIQLNAALQLAFMSLLSNVKSIPYNNSGYGLLRAAAADPITAALNFGTIRGGVTLSAAQIAEINTAAGLTISNVLQTAGWYLLIQNASSIVRAARGSPPMTLWYVSGESIQKINLASIDIL